MKHIRLIISILIIFTGFTFFFCVRSNGDPADLIEASEVDDAGAIRRLIAQGADTEQRNYLGDTAVILGSGWGSFNAVEALLDGGANVNAKQKDGGGTALMVASCSGRDRMVRLLLERGGKIDDREKKARLP